MPSTSALSMPASAIAREKACASSINAFSSGVLGPSARPTPTTHTLRSMEAGRYLTPSSGGISSAQADGLRLGVGPRHRADDATAVVAPDDARVARRRFDDELLRGRREMEREAQPVPCVLRQ